MNRNIKIFIFHAVILVLGFTNLFAQNQDFQSWNEISVEKKISKKVSLILNQDFRFQNNATLFKDYITVLGGHYKINKYLKIRGSYRFTYSYDVEDLYEYEHRFYGDIILRKKIDRFILGYRARYQLKYTEFDVNRWHHIRNRVNIKYNIPKSSFLPYAEYECYYSLNNPIQNTIDRNRYTVGLEYGVNDYLSVYSFYRLLIKREPYKDPYNGYILGLGLSFDI